MTSGPGSPHSAHRVSVVIAVHNGAADLDRCLSAIASSRLRPVECIVVDDASTDPATVATAERHGTRVIRLADQGGPARARNLGAAAASGDVLFFTDADVCIHPDTIEVAVEALSADPGLSAVIGSYDDEPGHPSFLSQYKNLFHHWVHQTSGEQASTFWTGCGAIRRDAFIAIGGFNQGYPRPSIEDIELGFRLRNAGHRIRLEKRMLAQHLKCWRFWNLVHTDIFRRGVPWIALLLRDRFAPKDLNLSSESKHATILAYLLALSLVALPLLGYSAALLPVLAVLAATLLCIPLQKPRFDRARADVAIALTVLAPVAAFVLAPYVIGAVPLLLWAGIWWTHRPFYGYMAKKRGIPFAIAVAPVHVVFLLSCGVCVPLGIAARRLDRRRARDTRTGPAIREQSPLSIDSRSGPRSADA